MTKQASLLTIPAALALLALSGCHPSEQSSFEWSKHKQHAISPSRPSLVLSDSDGSRQIQSGSKDSRVLYYPGSKDLYNGRANNSASPQNNAVTMDIAPSRSSDYKQPRIDTLVGRKVKEIHKELLSLETIINKHDARMSHLQTKGDLATGNYYSLLAVINSYLQSGTTPGNPELVDMWNNAGTHLEELTESASNLGELSNDIAQTASKASFLQDSTHATFGLSGAIEEDHQNLTALEDQVGQSVTRLNRMLNVINDEINRRNSYLRTERLNMQTLSLAIANGEMYGQSMSSRLFARVSDAQDGFSNSDGFKAPPASPTKRPLVIIRFNKPDVQYKQPLYAALSQAIEKYPAVQFDIISVTPETNNPAETALFLASARRSSEDVLRSMTQMGVPTERIQMGNATDSNVSDNEVHLYIR